LLRSISTAKLSKPSSSTTPAPSCTATVSPPPAKRSPPSLKITSRPDTVIAVEATTNTCAVAGLLQPFVREVVPFNPLKTRAIAEARIKTDRMDASVLVHLLRTDFLPRDWVPDTQTQQLRHLTTGRANLTSGRTRLKNRFHPVLHQRLIPLAHTAGLKPLHLLLSSGAVAFQPPNPPFAALQHFLIPLIPRHFHPTPPLPPP
jgi:transposase